MALLAEHRYPSAAGVGVMEGDAAAQEAAAVSVTTQQRGRPVEAGKVEALQDGNRSHLPSHQFPF